MTTAGPTPSAQTPQPGTVEKPVTPITPAALPGSRVPGGPTRRQRWLSILAAVLLAVVGGIVLLAWPRDGGSPGTTSAGESADGTIGAAPGADGTTGSAPSGAAGGPGAAASASGAPGTGASAAPGLSATTSPGPTDTSGSFVVSSRITRGLLGASVDITVRNTGGSAAVWHSVTLQTASLLVGSNVSSSDPSVSYRQQDGANCFVPSNGNLAAGASFTFTVSVSGLLPEVTGTPLDTPPCPA